MKNLLNSERIKATFGNYGIHVLLQNAQLRISSLHVNKTVKTYAVVNYAEEIPFWLEPTHQAIHQGASIGETIKKSFNIDKEGLYLGEIDHLHLNLPKQRAAVYIYKLLVQEPNSNNWLSYCTITEIYCPSYLNLDDLKILYPTTKDSLNDELKNHFSQIKALNWPGNSGFKTMA